MIDYNFGVAVGITVYIDSLPKSAAGFVLTSSNETNKFLQKGRGLFRYEEKKGHFIASEELAEFEETIVNDAGHERKFLTLKKFKEEVSATFHVWMVKSNISELMDTSFRTQDLEGLSHLPSGIKPIYYIDIERIIQNTPIDENDIIAVMPNVLSIEKAKMLSLVNVKTEKVISPIDEDEINQYYDFREAPVGLYTYTIADQAGKNVWIDPLVYGRPPFALINMYFPEGDAEIQDLSIRFKKKS